MPLVIITLRPKSSTLDSQRHRCVVVDYSTVILCVAESFMGYLCWVKIMRVVVLTLSV